MKQADIEKRLASEISKEVPDVLENILSKCEPKNEKIVDFVEYKKVREQNKNKSKSKRGKSMYVAVAMFMLIFSSFFGFLYKQSKIVETVVLIDINPAIELKANKKDRVVSAKGLNEDGKKVVENMQSSGIRLKGTELDTVTTQIMSAVIREGFTGDENTVLVTVENSNGNKGQEIESRLIKNVDNTLKSNNIEGTVIGQNKKENEATAKLAVKYDINEGRAELIEKIVVQNPNLDIEQLVNLSVDDLSILAQGIGSVTILGFETKHYVSTQVAKESVYVKAEISESDNAQVSTSVGVAEGKVVYDISVKLLDNELLFKVDVKTGEILKWVKTPLSSATDVIFNNSSETKKDNPAVKSSKDKNAQSKNSSSASGKINEAIDSAIDDVADAVVNKIFKTKDRVIESVIK